MLRVGLTGGIASGKSTVAAELARRGAVLVDADALAREVVEPGTPGLDAVVHRFGPEVLDGERLDRAALGRRVFADAEARRDLERIIHPRVRARAAQLEAAADADAVVVHVIPLLVETGQADDFDLCVVVDLEPDTQLRRLRERNGLTAEEARARVEAQASRAERLAAADWVIDNEGSPADLRRQVDTLWSELAAGGAAG
ncbi:dephospho-CoA kinase [Friedmanniella luteola]|uniref:Dephospho-CoA kinase n=1 Tax=Friedmanniella luteola TaxID=546871 RepID=A0A1H1PFK9_9ACTN|nr:dephospho-CoA kinase [Friedmanniella luteola]SDS10088.1 dephospho-CoA kinase [Friedmanniella luteola]